MKNRTPRIQRSVDLSSNVTGMFVRASSAEPSMAGLLGSKIMAEAKEQDANFDDNYGHEEEEEEESIGDVPDLEEQEHPITIPAGSGLQAVRKVASLISKTPKPMRTFPNYANDDDLAGLFVRLADQARHKILTEKTLDASSIRSPFFTILSPKFQIYLLHKCISSLIVKNKNEKPIQATFFLDVTLHALLRTMVPELQQEIRRQKETDDLNNQGSANDDDGRTRMNSSRFPLKKGQMENNEDVNNESFCKHRTFVLAFYELCTECPHPLVRDSIDYKLWLSLIDDITLTVFNASPKLLTAMETMSDNPDEVIARMLSATDGLSIEWKDEYFVDAVISNKQLSMNAHDHQQIGGSNNDESLSCLFYPRDQVNPDDLRFANISLAALSFEDTADASFFTPFPINDISDEEERVEGIKQAVMLLQQSEDSANEAQAHASEMVMAAERAIHESTQREESKGTKGKKGKDRQSKLKEKLIYAKMQESTALEIREEQCRDLIQAISMLLHAVSQQSQKGWVWVWEKNGGRNEGDYGVRLQALEKARPFLGCTDFVFNMSGEGLWDYMVFAHSLCVTPEYLWNSLS